MKSNYFLNVRGIISLVISGLLFSATLSVSNISVKFPEAPLEDVLSFAKEQHANIKHLHYSRLKYYESSQGEIRITTSYGKHQILKFAQAIEPDSIPELLIKRFHDSKEELRALAKKANHYQSEYITLMRDEYGVELTREQIPNSFGPLCGLAAMDSSYWKNPSVNALSSVLQAQEARTQVYLRDRVDEKTYLTSIKTRKLTLQVSVFQEMQMRLRFATFFGPIIFE